MKGLFSPLSRFEAALMSGATCGAAAVSVLTALHFIASHFDLSLTLPEVLLLRLLGSVPTFTFGVYFALSRHDYLYFLPAAILLLWSSTRRILFVALTAVIFLVAAWVAAMASGSAYLLDQRAGLFPGIAGLCIAILLSAWRRWRATSTIVLAAGFAFGTLLAQGFFAFPFQDAFDRMLNPIWGFAPPVAVAAGVVLLLTFSRPPRPRVEWRREAMRQWGLITCCLACIVFVGSELRGLRIREPEPAGSRIFDDWAYDVEITGNPPQLVWTDRKLIHVLENVYGAPQQRYTIDDKASYYVERIWTSPTDGFYIQSSGKLDWWKEPAPGERVSNLPAVTYYLPESIMADSSTTWTIVEDPPTGRLFTSGEYYSQYAVFDRDQGTVVATGTISNAVWPFWHFTGDPDRRVLYATSALDDGNFYEMNLDSLAIERKATGLYVYKTELDAEKELLWGIRPLTGEVVAIDTRTYEMRYRIPVQFGLRGLARDPSSGDLYACSEFFGDVFRVDTNTRAVSRLGWCGRLCRNVFLDSERQTLWVATRDGVCRIDTGDRFPASGFH